MLNQTTIAIALASVMFMILLYLVFAKRGWNCTENGCTYGIGGNFDSYDKCNSSCKSNSPQKQFQVQSQQRSDLEVEGVEHESQQQCSAVIPVPYYSYIPGPDGLPWNYHNGNHYHGDHHKPKIDKSIKNKNQIFFNSATGPNV